MCDFISWVEKDGKLYYLTDAEVFSPKGRKRLQGCRDNDFIGHGAIRKFFGIGNVRGVDREERRFWDGAFIPKEIAAKIKNFDAYWGQMFSCGKYFMNDDLRYIICDAPPKWKVEAWEQLLKQKPSNDDLYRIICNAPPKWKVEARAELAKRQKS